MSTRARRIPNSLTSLGTPRAYQAWNLLGPSPASYPSLILMQLDRDSPHRQGTPRAYQARSRLALPLQQASPQVLASEGPSAQAGHRVHKRGGTLAA